MKKFKKDVLDFGKASVSLGISSAVVATADPTGGSGGASGLRSAAGFMPVMGTMVGAGGALRGLQSIQAAAKPKKKRRKK